LQHIFKGPEFVHVEQLNEKVFNKK
jgi:hypothetical protein